ncbi:MAG: hypothetical protein PHC30_08210 [Lentisphaeria bacterium]|nr:hypothetical protein [Lentisphaeria bacterium]
MIQKRAFGMELFFTGESHPRKTFHSEAAAFLAEFLDALAGAGRCVEDLDCLRFFFSDIANQAPVFRAALAQAGLAAKASLVGQAPVSGARVAVEAWCLGRPLSQPFHWFPGALVPTGDSALNTSSSFQALAGQLKAKGLTVADHVVRTWLYCRDIDNNYAGLVRARNEFFAANGLTAETHFIASTGIEGRMENPHSLVKLDALAVEGLDAGQVFYLQAPAMLSRTIEYGVSFERGTRLRHRDRAHYLVSGTASIDRFGRTLHEGDPVRQAVRMLDNVEALLASGGAVLADLVVATLYLRDPADAKAVRRTLRPRLPDGLPMNVVQASVCRPGWWSWRRWPSTRAAMAAPTRRCFWRSDLTAGGVTGSGSGFDVAEALPVGGVQQRFEVQLVG